MPLEDTSVKKALLDFIECPEYNNSSKIKKKRNIYGDEKETLMKVKEYMKISVGYHRILANFTCIFSFEDIVTICYY